MGRKSLLAIFCGETEFQHELPIERTTMIKWRKRVHAEGLEELFKETISTGLRKGVINKNDLKRVIVGQNFIDGNTKTTNNVDVNSSSRGFNTVSLYGEFALIPNGTLVPELTY